MDWKKFKKPTGVVMAAMVLGFIVWILLGGGS